MNYRLLCENFKSNIKRLEEIKEEELSILTNRLKEVSPVDLPYFSDVFDGKFRKVIPIGDSPETRTATEIALLVERNGWTPAFEEYSVDVKKALLFLKKNIRNIRTL
jgi:hypothetical protein